MIEKFFGLLHGLLGFAGGMILIALIVMWFGAVPLVAFIFGSITWPVMMLMTVVMVLLIVLVGYMIKK